MYSSLTNQVILSPNHSGKRLNTISRITPHCLVGQWGINQIGAYFQNTEIEASCNYGIDYQGKIVCCVEEENRSWCSSSSDNDNKSITIEIASDTYHPYVMTEYAYESMLNLITDICVRYNKEKIIFIPNSANAITYLPADNEMILTAHRWFANKACPGDWLYRRFQDIADVVNISLGNKLEVNTRNGLYKVQCGAFSNEDNALTLGNKLGQLGYHWWVCYDNGYYMVQCGAFKSIENAQNLASKLESDGFSTFVKTVR